MDSETAPKAIQAFFAVQWAGRTQVIHDDENAKPDPDKFVRLRIRHVDGFQASMGDPGNNRFRNYGNITAQVFVKQGDANITALSLAKIIKALFRNLELQGITFYKTYTNEVGADGHGYNQVNVHSTFRYDELA